MWPSIKRWRDWATPELLPIYVSAELGGLFLANQPIPWNAEAVIVEAGLRLPTAARRKEDFLLRLPQRDPIRAEALKPDGLGDRHRVFFRIAPPGESVTADIIWRDRFLGQAPIPIVCKEAFLSALRVQMPTLHARLGTECVACQTFLRSQCTGITAEAVLASPTSLAPLVDLGLTAEVRGGGGELLAELAVPLSGSQLLSRQALVSVHPRHLPKKAGHWSVSWRIAGREFANVRARSIAPVAFRRSLRVVGTRFVVDTGKGITLTRQPPGHGESIRFGPCFLVASAEPGMAARACFEIIGSGAPPFGPIGAEVLITDGPTPVMAGPFPVESLAGLQTFELWQRGKKLGSLPLHPAPEAKFTSEGGFRPPPEFTWSPAAEEELSERLGKLMGG